uniref:Replication factor A C-terminal domain-containing protein n=1 Tax=Lactuca sativa TaxID=4236 RepID=A0A9R1WGM6_LACSA|nr:hypothetical protein LSAT_V11C200083720 [Lactuca sativa]
MVSKSMVFIAVVKRLHQKEKRSNSLRIGLVVCIRCPGHGRPRPRPTTNHRGGVHGRGSWPTRPRTTSCYVHRVVLQDKTFIVRGLITNFVFQNNWYQTTCPTCKDPILKRGPQWYCSAHSTIENPTFTDPTDSISAIISDTSCRKLLNSTLEKLISDNPLINRKILPSIISGHKGQTKTMSI